MNLFINRTCTAWIVLFVCLVFGSAKVIAVEQNVATDYQVKAAMLYKFISYTTWPETVTDTAQSPYRIWVLGATPINTELQAIIAGRIVNGRALETFAASNIEQIVNPHIVFVSRDKEKFLPALAQLAEKYSFLIVTEDEQGLRVGSTINLRLVNGRIGFDISLLSAQKYNLKLSSRLLSVAASIEEGSH